MACIFATYSRNISTTFTLIHLHFILLWGFITGSISTLPANSGLCPIRTSSLKFHQQLSSVGKSFSDFSTFQFPSLSTFSFASPSSSSSKLSPSSSSASTRLSNSRSSSKSTSIKNKKKANLNSKLKDDPFLNRLSLDIHSSSSSASSSSSSTSSSSSSSVSYHGDAKNLIPLVDNNNKQMTECEKKKKRKELMNELINPSTFGSYTELVVIGLSHHTAPVEVREKLSIPETEWNVASTELCQYDSINEAAILSTCNRFEMYLVGRNQYEVITDAINYLLKRTNGTLNETILRDSIFLLSGHDAIWHLMRVTAGLDSIVIGEGQILSQVKHAHNKSIQEDGKAGPILSTMMKSCIQAGQRVRTETNICKGAISVSSAAVEFISMKLQQDPKKKISLDSLHHVVIGAGKMARLLLIHLQSHGVKNVTVVNRSPESVQHLQNELPSLHINYVPMNDLFSAVSEGDVIYPCTSSTTPIITTSNITTILHNRHNNGRHSKLRFIDISVPRNIHLDLDCHSPHNSSSSSSPPVECYNVDDLKQLVETNLFKRKREVLDAEIILQNEILKYELWKDNLGTIPMIQKLQNKAEELRVQELSKVLEKLTNLSEKEIRVVNSLSKGIVTTLLRGPLLHLRRQKAMNSTKLAITQLQAAFQLEE